MIMIPKSRRLPLVAVFAGFAFLLFLSQSFSGPLNLPNISSQLPLRGHGETNAVGTRPGEGRLHYLIAGSKPNLQLCRALLSSTITRFGAPIIAGWNATGLLDAAVTHLAKVRVVVTYLDSLPASADNDLFLMIDGYDVLMQFGPDVLIKRYFETAAMEDERIMQQLGPAHAEAVAGPLGRHIFFGADKVCWPVDWRRPACWAVPVVPHMDKQEFGPRTDTDDMAFNRPRWLNSGTIMGPIREVREFFTATLDRINRTYTKDYEFRESDQYYMSDIWGEQEVERIEAQLREDPAAVVPEGDDHAFWPDFVEGHKYNYHVAMDYLSNLFQTWAGYPDWVGWDKFPGPGYSRTIDKNVRNNTNFRPWQLHLQADVMDSVSRIWASTANRTAAMGQTSNELIRMSEFGNNIITRTILAMFHCTGGKSALDDFFPRMWYYPFGRLLVRSAIVAAQEHKPFTPTLLGGKLWYPAMPYPKNVALDDGGAWSDGSDDANTVEWLSFDSMCKEYPEELFKEPPLPKTEKAASEGKEEEEEHKEEEKKPAGSPPEKIKADPPPKPDGEHHVKPEDDGKKEPEKVEEKAAEQPEGKPEATPEGKPEEKPDAADASPEADPPKEEGEKLKHD